MRVLICDDTEMIRKTMRKFLEKAGHEVVAECAGGDEAVAMFSKFNPDVCLLDIVMPRTDGISTLMAIMSIDANAKCIMCTARDDQRSMNECLQLGAIDFLEKPFSSAQLIEALKKVN